MLLHDDLLEEVCMEQSCKFVAQGEHEKVCWLRKSLNELKQSLQPCFGRFSEVIIEHELKKSKHDHFMLYKLLDSSYIPLVVYVDDSD